MDSIYNGISVLAATAPAGGSSGTIGGLLLFIGIALGVSFLCSILEAAILSTPPSYVETEAETGSRAGKLMQKFKRNVDEPISAILTLNTFAHTLGASGAGAQAVGVFGSDFAAVIAIILTILILILSEIIPKTLGAVYWRQLFSFTANTIWILILVLYPFVVIFKVLAKAMTSEDHSPTFSRSELEMMAQIGTNEGTLEEKEGRILNNLFQLDGVQVWDIMTPRTVVLAFEQNTNVGEVVNNKRVIPYSRIPVYKDDIDHIIGFVLRHDILKAAANDEPELPLSNFIRPIHPIPETLSVAKVLNEFTRRQEHIFLVIDEYGGTAGIITMEDAIEALLGTEITDESDIVEDMRTLAQQRFIRQKALQDATSRTSNSNGSSPKINTSTDQMAPAAGE